MQERQERPEEEPTVEEVIIDLRAQKTQARKVNILLKRYQGWFKKQYELTNFEEPALLLIRRTGKIEFREKATQGLLEIMHTDGHRRFIVLDPRKQLNMEYGTRTIRTYIVHEDYPFPLPENPIIDSESFTTNVEQTLNNIGNFRAKEINATANLIKTIAIGGAILLALFIVWKMVIPDPQQAGQTAVEAVKIAKNMTPF